MFGGECECPSAAYGRELDSGDQFLILRHRRSDIDAVAAKDSGQLVKPGRAAGAGEADPLQFGQLVEPDTVGIGQSSSNFR